MHTRSHSLRQASKPLRDLADPDSIRATGPPPPDTAPPNRNGPAAKPGTPTEASAEALRDALTRFATGLPSRSPTEAPPSPTQTPPSSAVTPPGPTEAAAETAPYHRTQQLPHQQPPPRHPTDE